MRLTTNARRVARAVSIAACLGGALLAASAARAADNGLFASNEPLVLRIEAPFATIRNTRSKPEYQDATLKFQDAGAERSVDIRIRVRGKSRVQACDFPPLLVNFKTSELVDTLFRGEDKLKLVTHCRASAAYEQYLRLEYLTYRALNLLTDVSLRARPLTVTYYDTERQREVAVGQPGIFLEDEDRFAKRMGFKKFEAESIDRARFDRDALGLAEMFQYFIGNTDWSATAGPKGTTCCHNVVPYERPDGMLVPVIYDFDSTGMVDVPYALPNERLPISSVRQRLYRGVGCESAADIEARLAKFDAVHAQLTELYSMSSGLDKRTAAQSASYIEAFFAIRADPKKVERTFRSGCKD